MRDLRLRCQAHAAWLRAHPDAVTAAEAWADDALTELTTRVNVQDLIDVDNTIFPISATPEQ